MNLLHDFWHALEEVHGHCATLFEWRKRVGSGFDIVHALRFLHPLNSFAESIPISNAAGADWYRILPLDHERVVAFAQDGGHEVVIPKTDSLIYRVEFRTLCRHLAQRFGFHDEVDPVADVPSVHAIGAYRPTAGFSYSALLTCPRDEQAAVQAAEAILSRIESPFLFFVPTRHSITRKVTDSLEKRKSICINLIEAIDTDASGKIVVAPAFNSTVNAFFATLVPQVEQEVQAAFFPTPPDARWCDLRIKFSGDMESVSIQVGKVRRRLTYVDMGFVDRRNGRPDSQWELLYQFACGHGNLTWESPGAHRKNQARRDALVDQLKAFFRIDGEPIEYIDKPNKGWRTEFSIELQ